MTIKILTIEDDERIRTAVRFALEDEGWSVLEAETGEQALEITDTLIKSGSISVLVVDSVAALRLNQVDFPKCLSL